MCTLPQVVREDPWDMSGSTHPLDRSELRRMTDEQLLATVAATRTSDSDPARENARRAWNELVERDVDRVRALVKTWHLPGRPDVRVEIGNRDDAIQHAFYRLLKMVSNFKGTVMPQYRAAMATCIDWACREFCRWEMRHEIGLGGSLDDELSSEDGDHTGRFDHVIAEQSTRVRADVEAGRGALSAIAAAIEALPNANMRSVLRLTIEGYQSKEIAEQLDLSTSNVDQLRSRALRTLQPLISDHADV
jgi:RNA polymerase sigma factor (sigma-70 family)